MQCDISLRRSRFVCQTTAAWRLRLDLEAHMSATYRARRRSAPIYGNKLRLTLKQERFSSLLANGLSASASYRSTYNTTDMKPQTVWREAHRLRRHARVAQRIEQLQQEHQDLSRICRSSIRRTALDALEALMMTSHSEITRIKAAKLLGRSVGIFARSD